jgi:hypothetical protein
VPHQLQLTHKHELGQFQSLQESQIFLAVSRLNFVYEDGIGHSEFQMLAVAAQIVVPFSEGPIVMLNLWPIQTQHLVGLLVRICLLTTEHASSVQTRNG